MNTTTETPPSGVITPTGGPQRKRSIAPFAIVGILALLVIGLFLRSRGGKTDADRQSQGPKTTLRTVRVTPLRAGTIVERIDVTGQLRSNQNVQLNSKIAGRISRVLVNEGDRVRRGQMLITLDDADLRQQVDSARANLQSAQVNLQKTRVGLPARIAEINSAIDQANAQLTSANAQVNSANARYKQALLNEPSQITQTRGQIETANAQVSSAQARLKQARDTARQTQQQVNAGITQAQGALGQARAQLEQVRNGSRQQEIASAQAQVNLNEAQVRDAQTNLNRQQTLYAGGATAKVNVDTAQTQLEVAQAQLESSQQQLSLVREGSRTEEVRQAEQVVTQREAALTTAQADRNRVLVAQAAVTDSLGQLAESQQGLRNAQANQAQIPITRQETRTALEALRQAQAGARQAEVTLRQSKANRAQIPVAQADVPTAEAGVAQARAGLEQAQLTLDYARIYSPVNGVVNTKSAESGQTAQPGTSLLNLVALDSVYFEAQIPETQLAQVKLGQPTLVTVTAISNAPITGYVTEIIPVADDRLRQFRVRITLPSRPGLTPGAFARGVLQTNVMTNTLSVPSELVHTEESAPFVYVAVPGANSGEKTATVEKHTVKTGITTNGRTQLIGGVKAGDQVIEGNLDFQKGDKVKLADE